MVGKWKCDGYFWKRRISSETGTIQDMDIQKRELWHRLENEPERAYRAFECFLCLPSAHRTIVEAYRVYVGNSEAVKPSDTWTKWGHDYAWRERAAAFDNHIASKRRDAFERGIEEEAERQGALAERNRNRMNEMLTLSYERAAEWLEDTQPSELRAQDVLSIIRLHMDAVKAFEITEKPNEEVTWTEEEQAELTQIIKEIEADEARENSEGASEEGEEDSEESEGGER
jgi:hypothetical protein